ncbi:MAG: hypothetical protein H6693_05305 [Candidatus Latescibacteria bacterium]|nr:hypothetical protein [Candidatus Latescibacterota bacterium]
MRFATRLLVVGMLLLGTGQAGAKTVGFYFDSWEIWCLAWSVGSVYSPNHGYVVRAEESIEVLQLGVFDSTNTIFDPHYGLWKRTEVGIYSFPDGELLADVQIEAGEPGEVHGEYRYFDIDPVVLQAGQEYMFVRFQPSGQEHLETWDLWPDMQAMWYFPEQIIVTAAELMDPALTLLDGSWIDNYSSHLNFPTTYSHDNPGFMGAVNFRFAGTTSVESTSMSHIKSLY